MNGTASPLAQLTHIALSLDALNCGAVLVGRNGVIAHVNQRLCELINRRREELIGSDLIGIYPPDESRDAVRAMLGDFDRARDAEFFLPLPADERLPVVFGARPVGQDPVLGEYAVITLIDISRQKLAEQKLMEQNQRIGDLSDKVIQQASALREYADSLEDRVRERTDQLHDAHMEALYMLAIAGEARDKDTANHVRRIGRTAQALAAKLGMSPHDAERFGYSAVLHDVGKIHTPDRILKKPGPLTPRERELMQEHTLAGERILKPSPYFAQASRIARSHHENWDGSGYPDALCGEAIPLEARIVHLVDVYDALMHAHVYKQAWDRSDAIAEILKNRGVMFDPTVTDAFVEIEAAGELERVNAAVARISAAQDDT